MYFKASFSLVKGEAPEPMVTAPPGDSPCHLLLFSSLVNLTASNQDENKYAHLSRPQCLPLSLSKALLTAFENIDTFGSVMKIIYTIPKKQQMCTHHKSVLMHLLTSDAYPWASSEEV